MRVWGKKLQDLFLNALRGMVFYLKPEILQSKKTPKIKQEIKITSVDINSLLIDFLSEAVAQSDIKNSVFYKSSFSEFGENFLEGVIYGSPVDGFDKEIKAVSYHEVDIKRNPETGFYETTLVFDI